MKRSLGLATVCALTVTAMVASGEARAQAAAPQPVNSTATELDPVRMDLARQLVAASGGEAQAEVQIKAMFGLIQKSVAQNLSPQASALSGPIYDDMAKEMVKLAPQILDLSERAYAQNFTERELRDLLAFQTSETGREMVRKLPIVRAQVMAETMPLAMKIMPEIMRLTADRVCAEQHCTPQQRESIAQALTKALQKPGA